MKVTGQLKDPVLDPCPNRDDLVRRVDDQCRPKRSTRQREVDRGVDCCHYWTGPNQWQESQVRVDQIDPEKFKYEQFRYQLFVKPANFDCVHGPQKSAEKLPDRQYIPPVTDIRALRQTTVVPMIPGQGGLPVIPNNPGGVSEVTFPMTQQTLGQPDVTTACCIPVVPAQQGFQNLTSGIRNGPRCHEPPAAGRPLKQLGPQRPDACSNADGCGQHILPSSGRQPQQAPLSHPPPQYVNPPSNQQGTACGGLPPVFPQGFNAPRSANIHPPAPVFPGEGQGYGQVQGSASDGHCFDSDAFCVMTGLEDGLSSAGGHDAACTNVKTVRYRDRVNRDIATSQETPGERRKRLTRMSGAYGAALQAKQSCKRLLHGPKDNITVQGNGFSWSGYPKHENRMCYVLERNNRC